MPCGSAPARTWRGRTTTARGGRRTAADVARLSRRAGVQVPANEVLFFPNLPARVDTVKAKRGTTVSGPVMNVTNSRLAIDSSLSVSDVRLVRVGDAVTIEDQDLGITAHGRVSRRGRIDLVPVDPGLAAQGLAEVRPTGGAGLRPGDLVVVGSRDPTQ